MRTRPRHPFAVSVTAAATAVVMLAAPVAAAEPMVTVRAGDTLSQIAMEHGTTVERLTRDNRLADPDRIMPGQRLILVPAGGVAASPTPAGDAAHAPTVHVVAAGETLTTIAARYGTSVAAIAAANLLANPSLIVPGQRLTVGAAAASPAVASATTAAPAATAPAAEHIVAAGETLTAIAARYGTSVAAIAAANGIANASFIRSGMRLRIASAPAAVAPAPAGAGALPAEARAAMAARAPIGAEIRAEAERFGLPAALALAVAWQESGWQQGVTSGAGAVGVMQLLPSTGDWVAGSMLGSPVDVRDTSSNIRAGVRLLAYYHATYGGDRARILAAYYQGQYALETSGIYGASWPYINAVAALEAMFAAGS